MGYTRYWKRTDKKIDKELIVAVCEIIADCINKGINICNGSGEGNPVVTLDEIAINGNDEVGLAHETFYLGNEESDFEFCKTACKPYDYAVRKILRFAEQNGYVSDVSEDEEYERIVSDADFLKVNHGL